MKQAKIGHGVKTQSAITGLYQAELVLATRVDTRSKYVLFLFLFGSEVLWSAGTSETSPHLLDWKKSNRKGASDMAVTKRDLLERVKSLVPLIRNRARESEIARRPHDEVINALIDAEVMQALVPRCYGGHELDLDIVTDTAREISRVCMSTGWVTAFYIGHNWMLTKLSERAQRDVFADKPFGLIPIQPSPNVTIKDVQGGYEISGRSSFSSGIMHADWVLIAKAGGDDARVFLVPREDVEVDDVWHMSGMSATGSNDVIVEKCFVPEYRTIPATVLFETTNSIHDNPLYRIPLLPFIFCEVMGVYVGGLEGATMAFDELTQTKVAAWSAEVLAQRQAAHINLGEAHAQARAAGILLDQQVVDTQAIADAKDFTMENRLDLKLRATYISNMCRESVNTMMSRAGTRMFDLKSPLQRFFRDINVLGTHAFLDWEVGRELYGRNRLGLPPNNPLF